MFVIITCIVICLNFKNTLCHDTFSKIIPWSGLPLFTLNMQNVLQKIQLAVKQGIWGWNEGVMVSEDGLKLVCLVRVEWRWHAWFGKNGGVMADEGEIKLLYLVRVEWRCYTWWGWNEGVMPGEGGIKLLYLVRVEWRCNAWWGWN